mgnify:CR=1 FL=1
MSLVHTKLIEIPEDRDIIEYHSLYNIKRVKEVVIPRNFITLEKLSLTVVPRVCFTPKDFDLSKNS